MPLCFWLHNMNIYYAPGGGLGHLTRARAVIHTLNLQDVTIITSSPFADDKRVVGDIPVIRLFREFEHNPQGYRKWLASLFNHHKPTEIFIDTFPGGIVGEFCGFPFSEQVKLSYVARALRWDYYSALLNGSLPRFDMVYKVEQLPSAQDEFCLANSQALQFLNLIDPFAGYEPEHWVIEDLGLDVNKLWLIVHSNSNAETSELLALANETAASETIKPQIVVVSPEPPQVNVKHIDFYPASGLFPVADRIFTGCGFNAMRQTEIYKDKHYFIPFVRPFDDQQRRAETSRVKNKGATSCQI
jgi:hypothetical protein